MIYLKIQPFIVRKIILFSIYFFHTFFLEGRDTTLVNIITSPVPIRHLKNVNGKIIVSRYDGVFEFDGENFKKSSYDNDLIKGSLTKNESWARLADPKMDFAQVQLSNEGIYWVLIRNKFLYGFRIIDKINRFYPEYSIRGIYCYRDSVFVSTYNGFYLNNKQIFKDTLFFSNSNFWIEKDWIYFSANFEDNVYRVDKRFSNLELVIPGAKKYREIAHISGISFFNGYFYLGGQYGFGRYSEKSGLEIIDKSIEVSNIQILKGVLWVAGIDGAYMLEDEKLIKKFDIGCTALFQVGDKMLATSFNGLWEYDLISNKITNLFRGTRYEDIETDALFADQYGNYWVSSIDGILKYNVKEKIISSMLEGTEFNRRSYSFIGDTIFFGSNNSGLISFDVENMISGDVMNPTRPKTNNFIYIIFCLLLISLSIVFFKTIKPKIEIFNNTKVENKLDYHKLFSNLEVFVKENIDNVNVDQIRYHTGLTKYAFYTKFQEHFGKKPKEFIKEIKDKMQLKIND